MNRSGNYYSALANHQQDANMQRHMVGYDKSSIDQDVGTKKELENLILETKFKRFLNEYFLFIYKEFAYELKKEIRNNGFNLNELANYINKVNERLLEDPNFFNNKEMIKIGSYSRIVNFTSVITLNMFYNAGKKEEEPNTIRIKIRVVDYKDKTIIEVNADYNSDGTIVVYDAEKYSYDEFKFIEGENSSQETIDPSNFKQKSIVSIDDLGVDIEKIEKSNEFIQQIFELANLKTDKAAHRR